MKCKGFWRCWKQRKDNWKQDLNHRAEAIGRQAAEALRAEAGASPKPGLVDRENNGAHQDMDYAMLLRSADALEPYFVTCVKAGMLAEARDWPEDDLAVVLRQVGKDAEAAMYAVTGGVNTHKGAIFSMGILCCALGQLEMQKQHAGPDDLQMEKALRKQCASLGHLLFDTDEEGNPALVMVDVIGQISNGHAEAWTAIDCLGARGEAYSGFKTAFDTGLPALRRALAEGYSMGEGMIAALLALMTICNDSNVKRRGGMDGSFFVKEEAATILREVDLRTETGKARVRAFDQACVARNLSPGGSADLLALTVMIYWTLEEKAAKEEKEK